MMVTTNKSGEESPSYRVQCRVHPGTLRWFLTLLHGICGAVKVQPRAGDRETSAVPVTDPRHLNPNSPAPGTIAVAFIVGGSQGVLLPCKTGAPHKRTCVWRTMLRPLSTPKRTLLDQVLTVSDRPKADIKPIAHHPVSGSAAWLHFELESVESTEKRVVSPIRLVVSHSCCRKVIQQLIENNLCLKARK